ncbi:hypothetical protein DFH28DRAFT_980470 [Melampsora americana]|nr:hypothetical protein DFH28DRAFT_980470 [Melampsora americana]
MMENFEKYYNGKGLNDHSIHYGNIDDVPASYHQTGGLEDIFTQSSSPGASNQHSQFLIKIKDQSSEVTAASFSTPKEDDLTKMKDQDLLYNEKPFKDTKFHIVGYSNQIIHENETIFMEMPGFWFLHQYRMRDHLRFFFPNNPQACHSFAIWTSKNMLFPLVMHRASWMLKYFAKSHPHFPFADLDSTLKSAKEYFKSWMVEEVNDFYEATMKVYIETGPNSLYKNRSKLLSHLKSKTLYNLEFLRKGFARVESVSWTIISKWLSQYEDFWRNLCRGRFLGCKREYNRGLPTERFNSADYQQFNDCKDWLDNISRERLSFSATHVQRALGKSKSKDLEKLPSEFEKND